MKVGMNITGAEESVVGEVVHKMKMLVLILNVYLQIGFPVTMSFCIWRLAIYEKSSQVGLLQISGWKSWLIALFVSIVVSIIVKLAYDGEYLWGSVAASFTPVGLMLILFGDRWASAIVLEIILGLMTGFAVIQVSRIAYGKSKGKRYKKFGMVMKWLMGKLFRIGAITFSIASVILVLADVKSTLIRNYVKQEGVAKDITIVDDKVFSSNACVLKKLKRENWYKASLTEREQACYELMQLYMLFFTGTIDEETRMMAGNDFQDEVFGYYCRNKNYVLIDRQHMADDESYVQCLNCVAHETYHWFQHEILEYGKEADIRDIIPDGHLSKYSYEFKNYISVEMDVEAYQKQLSEMDAYDFADWITPQLLKLIWSI